MNPLPDRAMDRPQSMASAIEPREFLLKGHRTQRAVGSKDPSVEAAGHYVGAGVPEGLVAGLRDDLVAAVWADIVECSDIAVLAANDDDRRARDIDALDLVVARFGDFLDPPHLQPNSFEQMLAFKFEEFGRDQRFDRNRPAPYSELIV